MEFQDIIGKKHRYKHNNFRKDTFFLKSTVMYGMSGTGKSFLLNEYLKSLRDEFYFMLCFSETAEVDKMFPMNKYTPFPCIYKGLDVEKLQMIIETAEKRMSIYRMCREIDRLDEAAMILFKIFEKSVSMTERWKKLMKAVKRCKRKIEGAEDRCVVVSIEDEIVGLYRILMNEGRMFIKTNNIDISSYPNEYIICITQVKLNPYVLIVFNDLGDEISSLNKKDRGVLESFFNKGRHMGITIIILLQNPQQISKVARQSVNNHIFTTTDVFYQYIDCISGGSALKKKAADAVEAIINTDEKKQPKDRQYFKILMSGGDIQFVKGDKMGEQFPVGKKRFRKVMEYVEIKPENRIDPSMV
jgi:hypothetical protein